MSPELHPLFISWVVLVFGACKTKLNLENDKYDVWSLPSGEDNKTSTRQKILKKTLSCGSDFKSSMWSN